MAFPVSPTNGQTAIVNNITYQFSNVGNTWTRLGSTANTITANIITANTLNINTQISVTGNVTGNYILGNGALLTGITTSSNSIFNGTSNVTVVSSGGNVTVGVGGTSNIAVFATTGEYITGLVSASGNITGGNILTAGAISATGTLSVTGNTTLSTTSTGNLSAGNVTTGGIVSATANITGGNILTSGLISVAGNVTAANFFGNIYTNGYYYANGAPFSGGGGGTPGGANTQIQFNDGGVFSGSAALTFDKTSNAVTASANITGGNIISLGIVSTVGRPTFGAITLPNTDGTANQLLATYGNGSLYFANVSAGNVLSQTFTGNGVQTVFTLSSAPPSINSTFVSYNGVLLLRSTYSLSGANITFSSAPANASSIEVTTVNPGSGGLSGTPTAAGTDTQVQFNDGGIFGANANLTFNKTSGVFTAKNLASGGSINETVYTITDGAAVDLNPTNGTVQLWTLGASRTPTASSFSSGQSMTLMITANVYSITWTSVGVNWVGNSAPTLASTGNTVIVLWKVSSTVYGALSGTV